MSNSKFSEFLAKNVLDKFSRIVCQSEFAGLDETLVSHGLDSGAHVCHAYLYLYLSRARCMCTTAHRNLPFTCVVLFSRLPTISSHTIRAFTIELSSLLSTGFHSLLFLSHLLKTDLNLSFRYYF